MFAIVFALVFVSLGAGTLFVAMSGRGGSRTSQPGAGGRRTVFLAFAGVLLVLGIGTPIIAIASDRHSDTVAHSTIKLTADQKRGRELFGTKCRICHTLAAANAVAQTGPNLDIIAAVPSGADKTARKQKYDLVYNAITNGKAAGNGQMAAGIVDGKDKADVIDFVTRVAGKVIATN